MIGNMEDSIFSHYQSCRSGLVTIDDVWNTLLFNGKIDLSERLRVKKLSHEDQQKELEKYGR
jgi:hypothetical protein